MTHLKFMKDQGSDTNYDVKFNFEYDLNLKKKVSSVTFRNLDLKQKLTVPWSVFLYYAKKKPQHPFVNNSGLKIWAKGKNLVISNSSNFNLTLSHPEITKILENASNSENGFSNAVEGVLKEYVTQR